LKQRWDSFSALWVTDEGERLQYSGLRSIIVRRAKLSRVPTPSPHDFRRAFALNMLRAGVDLITLSRLMGHSSLAMLQRYLKQLPDDLREAHQRASPVDNAL
jgi:integrase/recombinase XerD